MRYAQYLKHKLAYDPWQQTVLNIFGKCGIRIQPFYLFLEGLSAAAPTVQEEVTACEINFLQSEDMDQIGTLADRNIPTSILRHRLENGNICLGAWLQGELMAFTWCNFDRVTYEGYPCNLAADEAYLFDAYTATSFRGKGLAPYIRYRSYLELKTLGRTKLYSITERFNRSSMRFKQKLGARVVDSGLLVEFFKCWRFYRHRDNYLNTY